MTDTENIQIIKDMLVDLFSSYSNELQSKVSRLDKIIGSRHWLSVGTYKESILKDMILGKIPKKYEVGTGFVMSMKGGTKKLSRQIDILIWDSNSKSPIFRDGEFVVIPPEACRCAIEVKSTLTHASLKEAIENIDSLSQFADHARAETSIYKAIFAYETDDAIRFPDSIHNTLYNYYSNAEYSLDNRLEWMRRNIGNPGLPWINHIACLDKGSLTLIPIKIGEDHHACYNTQPILDPNANDTYGLMERQLIASLLVGTESFQMLMFNPGIHQVYSYFKAESFTNTWSIIPQKNPSDIVNIGPYGEPFVSNAKAHLYLQRRQA